jgi:hypothetical protein
VLLLDFVEDTHTHHCFVFCLHTYVHFVLIQSGHTALFLAAAKGHTDSVRLFLQAGADKDMKHRIVRFLIAYRLLYSSVLKFLCC